MSHQSLKNINPYHLAFTAFPSYITLQYSDYIFAPYHIVMAKHLMLVEQGLIDRLIIATPPRHGKTMMVSEFFPAWYIGRNPTHQIIATTYSYERATDTGRKIRNQMVSDVFKETFPECDLSTDSRSANRLSTDKGGNCYSVGVEGAIAGRGADLFLIDDPLKGREEADSEINRRKLIKWYKSVAYTRLLPGGRIIVISTRWHYDDLTGFLLDSDSDRWTVLKFPAVAEEDESMTGRKKGDALWPEKYPIQRLNAIENVVGSREWNSLYQQEPLNEEGGIVKMSWFRRYSVKEMVSRKDDEAPFGIFKIAVSWDTSFKESEIHDPSCATIWGISRTGFYLLFMFNKQMQFPELTRKVIEFYTQYASMEFGPVVILIEDKASGQSLIQVLETTTNIPIVKIVPSQSKVIRMEAVTHVIETGRVYLPDQAPWLPTFERQMSQFPLGKFKDVVDSTSQFLKWAAQPQARRRKLKFWK